MSQRQHSGSSRDDGRGDAAESSRRSAPAVRVSGLTKTFGEDDDAVTAVDDVSFEIESGSVVGLLGPNGAGKTTTIKSMLGLILPDEGTVEVSGIDVHDEPNRAYDRIGAMLEGARNTYWRLTVQDNLEFFAGLGGDAPADVRDRHDRLLAQLDLEEKADTTVNELSRGMKQKVSLASTLARDVDVVFMDEPTLGLDVEMSLELRSELRRLADEQDVTIVLCSHDMDVIEAVCDRVLILSDGSVIAHESVTELLDLFRTRGYRATVDAPVSDDVRRRLEREFDAQFTERDDVVIVEATAPDGEAVYDLVATLRETGQTLRDLTSHDPDLEEVFLQITRRTDSANAPLAAGAETEGVAEVVGDGDD